MKVEANLSVSGHPNVFVVGDTACVMQDGKLLPGVAPVAMQEGRYVASLIAQKVAGKNDKDNVQPFHYHDKGNLATVGRSFGIVDIGRFRFSGFFAWVTWLFIHIFYLIGFRNRFVVMFQWAWAYLTYQRGARLITFDTNPNKPV